ncbi:MAG: Trk system potassium transporter TrkA [Bacteroidetes bacterium]|nr:Trk system potassium transporter TrkA [Bacteroidota bacterium]
MHILIAGDNEVGLHLARLFSMENHDITLVCPDKDLIKIIETHSDLMTIVGDSTSREVLLNANVKKADLVISVLNDGRLNLLTCIMSKQLGAKVCIAKVDNAEYLEEDCKQLYISFGVDYIVSPERIVSKEITNLLKHTAAAEIFDFSDEQLFLMLIRLDKDALVVGKSLDDIVKEYEKLDYRAVAIHRKSQTIIPKGSDVFMENDMAYVVAKKEGIDHLLKLGGKKRFDISNIMIVGGGTIGSQTALALEKKFNVKLFEMNKERSIELSDMLQNTLIINGDARDINLLEDERIGSMDAFVSVTNSSETNILTCLLARRYGVKKTIALVENLDYVDISQNIGIDTIINKKTAIASYIVKFTLASKVLSTKCLTGIDAEVFEFVVKPNSPVTKKPIRKLSFPDKAIIGGIIRDNEGYIAVGDFQIKEYDKVVVFALPQAFNDVDKFFKS